MDKLWHLQDSSCPDASPEVSKPDGWPPARKLKRDRNQFVPSIIPPPQGEVSDEEEKAYHRRLQRAESRMKQ